MIISKRGITKLSELAIDADLAMAAHAITINAGGLIDGKDVSAIKEGAPSLFGDGADGDAVVSSNTNLDVFKMYNDLTIDSGITLTSTLKYLVIFVKGTLTVEGTISMIGKGAAGGAGGAGGDSVFQPYEGSACLTETVYI